MFTKLEFMIAMRYLRARRREGFISVVAWFSLIGVMLGVATLIVVLSVMNGFRTDLLSRIIGINGHVIVVNRGGEGILDYDNLSKELAKLPNVVRVTPLVEGQALASFNNKANGVMVRGYRVEDFKSREVLSQSVVRKQGLEEFSVGQGGLIGSRLGGGLGLYLGADLTLLSPKLQNTVFGSVPKATKVKIVGQFDLGMYEYDNGFLFLDLKTSQDFLGLKDKVSRIEILGTNADQAQALAVQVQKILPAGYITIPWQQVNGSFFTALQVERNVMFIILTLIILVAAFNIVSSQIMLVKDKARGIAILRSMGASRSMILKIFLLSGSAVGVLGAVFGAILGISFALNIEVIRKIIQAISGVDLFSAEIYFLSNLPSEINAGEVGLVVAMALILSLLASIYPAWRAARMDPVEVLRYG